MKLLKQYGAGLLACVLLAAAGLVMWRGYLPARKAYEREKAALAAENLALETQLQADRACGPVQEQLEPAAQAIRASRQALYDRFPVELKEEDQILYMLHLEELLGGEVLFEFERAAPLLTLSDGAVLRGMTFSFEQQDTTYQEFKKRIKAISGDRRIASVHAASYDPDTKTGQIRVILYLLEDGRAYAAPGIDDKT